MLGTKALAATWDFIGLDEMKRANVTLRDGSIYQTYMGYVSYIPDVQVAWAKLLNAVFGSFIFSTIGAAAFAWPGASPSRCCWAPGAYCCSHG